MTIAGLRAAFTIAPWAAILLLLAWSARLNDLRDRWHHQYTAEHSARLADRKTYEAAQAEAQAKNQAHVAKVEQQQQRITTDAEKSYAADLARLRAELNERLRNQGNATPKGAPGQPATPAIPDATGQPDGPSRVSIPTGLYVRGAELELQLERLQGWVRDQMKVDTNK